MIKRYCDVCGKEVERNYVAQRLRQEMGRVVVEVMVAIDGIWNKGEICLGCLTDVLVHGSEEEAELHS